MRKPDRHHLLLALLLLLGLYTRFVGLDRGTSDFLLPEQAAQGLTESFYHFHPDETTLIDAALELSDPLDPPLTTYGMLPLYLLRGSLELDAALSGVDPRAEDPVTLRHVYRTGRALSALLSVASLLLAYALGRRLFDRWTALLGAFLLAVVPALVQSAHFGTVDGIYLFFCLAGLCLIARLLDNDRWRDYLLAGLLVGATGAIRLNGLLLGPVLLAAHLARQRRLRSLLAPRLWAAALAALGLLLLLQPYMVADPQLLWRADSTDDLGLSLQIARGELLRLWTLVDLHTVPYLHYWTHLFPLAAGWPLTLGFLAGISHALYRRRWTGGLLLLWSGLYFGQMGGLFTKHVRYLLPLLPGLCLLAAHAGLCLARFRPKPGYILVALIALYTGFYGLAFTRIYRQEDGRIQAARWIAANVPEGSRIGVERGGFGLGFLISDQRHSEVLLNTSPLFEARGLVTCRAALIYLKSRLRDLDYIAITDVNRYQQFLAAADRLPALASFYAALVDHRLGFEPVARFKVYPGLAGIQIHDDGAEPSFTGYDHPAVFVLRRRSPEAVALGLEHLERRLMADPHCPDSLLHRAAQALDGEQFDRAEQLLAQIADAHPRLALTHLLAADLYARTEQPELEEEAMARYEAVTATRPAQVFPWAVGMALLDLDLFDMVEPILVRSALKSPYMPSWVARELSEAYVLLANRALERDRPELARAIYQLSAQIYPNAEAFNRLGFLAYRAEDYSLAVQYWNQSLGQQEEQAPIHANVGQVQVRYLRRYDRALHHLTRAARLDPNLADDLAPWIEAATRAREAERQ